MKMLLAQIAAHPNVSRRVGTQLRSIFGRAIAVIDGDLRAELRTVYRSSVPVVAVGPFRPQLVLPANFYWWVDEDPHAAPSSMRIACLSYMNELFEPMSEAGVLETLQHAVGAPLQSKL